MRPAIRPVCMAWAAALALLLLGAPRRGEASCGAQSCPLDMHSLDAGGGAWALDLSWQHVPQDQVRAGTRRVAVGTIPSPEDEKSTFSDVATLGMTRRLSARWSVGAALPWVWRTHDHMRNAEGLPPLAQRWAFSGAGDAQVTCDWTFLERPESSLTLTLRGALVLPTGRTAVEEVAGDQPEPGARPGAGAVDAMAGLHAMANVTLPAPAPGTTSVFAGLLARRNGRGTAHYRLGDEALLSAGASWPAAPALRALLQANLRLRGKDDVGDTDALRDNTGGTWLFLSPGLRLALGHGVSASVVAQIPAYQRVNRIQIVAPAMFQLALGWSR